MCVCVCVCVCVCACVPVFLTTIPRPSEDEEPGEKPASKFSLISSHFFTDNNWKRHSAWGQHNLAPHLFYICFVSLKFIRIWHFATPKPFPYFSTKVNHEEQIESWDFVSFLFFRMFSNFYFFRNIQQNTFICGLSMLLYRRIILSPWLSLRWPTELQKSYFRNIF